MDNYITLGTRSVMLWTNKGLNLFKLIERDQISKSKTIQGPKVLFFILYGVYTLKKLSESSGYYYTKSYN